MNKGFMGGVDATFYGARLERERAEDSNWSAYSSRLINEVGGPLKLYG